MSATHTEDATEHRSHHPTPRQYVQIALMLGVLTALEVSTYYFDFGQIAIPMLIVLMAIKFVMVASWFMHLKFDSRVFSRMMYTGLTLAIVLYVITLTLVLLGHMPWV